MQDIRVVHMMPIFGIGVIFLILCSNFIEMATIHIGC